MFASSDVSRAAIVQADELIAALQAEFVVSERLGAEVGETLCAAASAHLRACLLQHKWAELAGQRDHWWHAQLTAATRAIGPEPKSVDVTAAVGGGRRPGRCFLNTSGVTPLRPPHRNSA